jgi:hypothetical protein
VAGEPLAPYGLTTLGSVGVSPAYTMTHF